MSRKIARRSPGVQERRKALAIVDLAVCLPILALLAFATIEARAMIQMQQALEIAAYEGARVAVASNSNQNNIVGAVRQSLRDKLVLDPTIRVSPPVVESVAFGDYITVSVSAPCARNSTIANWCFGRRAISAEVKMMKET